MNTFASPVSARISRRSSVLAVLCASAALTSVSIVESAAFADGPTKTNPPTAITAKAHSPNPAAGASVSVDAPDEVTLKNGTSVRCTLISSESGQKVVILEAGASTTRTIGWAEVADIEKGKYAAATTTEAGATKAGYANKDAAETDGAATPQETLQLHVDSPVPVTVTRTKLVGTISSGGYRFGITTTETVCQSPCDKAIPMQDDTQYVVSGPDFSPEYLPLHNHRGRVYATLGTGSPVGRGIGKISIYLGVIGVIGGGTAWALGPASHDPSLSDLGMGVTIAGGIVLVGGIVLALVSTQTVQLSDAQPRTAKQRTIKPRYWAGEF